MEYQISEKVRAWAKANLFDPELHLDMFNDYLANKAGKPYKDMDAAFRTCVRCDWGNLRRQQAQNNKLVGYVPPSQVKRANTAVPLPTNTVVPMPANFGRKA